MKIAEMLREAQYSRITVGNRWLVAAGPDSWKVLERKKHSKIAKTIVLTNIEDEAVNELLKGEPLYNDLVKKMKG